MQIYIDNISFPLHADWMMQTFSPTRRGLIANWLNHLRRRPSRRALPVFRLKHRLGSQPVRDDQTGFIHHPSGVPIEIRRIWFGDWRARRSADRSDIGFIFESERYLPPGATVEVTIPTRAGNQRFRGKIVLVRHNGECHDLGLWLPVAEEAVRLRIVEQICHIEAYLQQKKYAEGPYALNRERIAAEWIDRYAGNVPSI
jgi:hypothetical protein